jgi:hypothetical protein
MFIHKKIIFFNEKRVFFSKKTIFFSEKNIFLLKLITSETWENLFNAKI